MTPARDGRESGHDAAMGAARVSQLDMFADVRPERAAFVRTEFTEFPDSLIRRLGYELRRLEQAEFMWWSVEQLERETRMFMGCVRRLPPERRGDLAERWAVEVRRLGPPAG